MMQPAAINLGIHLRVLSATATDSAAQVIPDTVVGSHEDWEALKSFALECDVITFDHEHVPIEFLEELQKLGIAVRPGPQALRYAQDKIEMRTALTAAGIACPKWKEITSESDLTEFGELVGWPLVLKTARGGYDGKGVWVVKSLAEAVGIKNEIHAAGNRVLAE
jgi:5-(carboxyamino)imidazole ribonucleotide synthase